MRRLLDNSFLLWILLAFPSAGFLAVLLAGTTGPNGEPATHFLLHPTGEFSARFMIIAMMLTPLTMLFPGSRFLGWMMRRRRYFGVAAFFYAAFHTLLYLADMASFRAILADLPHLGIWTGWLAFVIFIPLAVTSNDFYLRRLGPKRWKTLQRWVYVAAVATLLHWIFVHNEFGPAMVHFLPLAFLETYRIIKNRATALA